VNKEFLHHSSSSHALSKMKPLRLSLSGAGFLGAWHLGVSEALLRAGVLENGSLQVAGASAGAIVGAVIVAGVPLQQARLALSALAMEARAQPLGIVTPGYSLVDGVRKHLDEHLPLDAHQRASGRLHVALTSLRPGEVGALYHKCSFGSRDELIHAVTSSSDIPGLTGCLTRATTPCLAATALPAPANVWQALTRRLDVDGGLWDLFPDPWHGTCDVAFVSPFAGVGFAISPCPSKAPAPSDSGQEPPTPVITGKSFAKSYALAIASRALSAAWPAPRPMPTLKWKYKHGRSLELSPENLVRFRHALSPPSDATLAAYEAEGFARCAEWMQVAGIGDRETRPSPEH